MATGLNPGAGRTRRLLLLGGAALAVVLLARFAAGADGQLEFGGTPAPAACGWHLAGASCPGCGLTRATMLLGRGEWTASWSAHPGLAPLLALLLLEALAAGRISATLRPARGVLILLLLALSLAHWLRP